MRSLARRTLVFTLAIQQLTFAVPAGALVDAPTGLPVDGSALASHAQNRGVPAAVRPETCVAPDLTPVLRSPGRARKRSARFFPGGAPSSGKSAVTVKDDLSRPVA